MTSTKFNISEAGRVVGKSRATIQRALKAGTLSASLDANGNKRIDASELLRVYGDEADFGRVIEAEEGERRNDLAELRATSKLEAAQNKLEAQYKAEIERLDEALRRSQEGQTKLIEENKERREQRAREWERQMEVLSDKLANQRTSELDTMKKAHEEETRKLKRLLQAEREKTVWQKLFG